MNVTFSKSYRQCNEMRVDVFADGKPSGIVLHKSNTGKWDAKCEGYFKVKEWRYPVFAWQFFAWEMSLREAKKYISAWLNSGRLYLTKHSVRTPEFKDYMPVKFLGTKEPRPQVQAGAR